ncbi:MAG: DUF58 domain-containing protein [Planctomycetota bacterium]
MEDERDDELAELLAEVRRIEVQANRLVRGVMAGGYSSVFRGAGIEFDEVREYVPGDDPRSVDWNVTARVGRPFVKKYVDERELTVMFLLDVSASTRCGFGTWSMRQAAARICACLAMSAVRNDDKVGLIAFSSRVEHHVPPQKGAGHALRIVRDCLALRGEEPGTDLRAPLDFVGRVLRRKSILFLVSDFLTPGFERELGLCARRHDLIAVRLQAPELAAPDARLVRFRDPESGAARVVDWSCPRTRAGYEERVATWRAQTADILRRVGVDLMDVRVPRDPGRDGIAKPILEFFRMRELRGEKR